MSVLRVVSKEKLRDLFSNGFVGCGLTSPTSNRLINLFDCNPYAEQDFQEAVEDVADCIGTHEVYIPSTEKTCTVDRDIESLCPGCQLKILTEIKKLIFEGGVTAHPESEETHAKPATNSRTEKAICPKR